jgi:hypothetical protein
LQQQQEQQAAALAQQQQQQQQAQHRASLPPTSPIDDDPGYFPDPYANQPEYASAPTTHPQAAYQQPPLSPVGGGSGSELAHALGQYQGYSLADPGAGQQQQQQQQPRQPRQGYSLTDPGSGSAAAAAPAPASPVVDTHAHAGFGAPAPEAAASSAASTPSWVLPKKSPNPGARGPGAGLAGQFAGMQV